ncbi:MAG: molybdate ABC transporter permease subunit [Spirochaetales bacterium]|nr:molybdate ABC transporter permease subunit [Spirochaetales bacterium]
MTDIILLSVRIAFMATCINLPLGLVFGFLLTRTKLPGRSILEGCANMPLVMPPVTIGYMLLLIFGRNGFAGVWLFKTFGASFAFSRAAAVAASVIVSFPLVARSIKVSMEMVDRRYESAASVLGAGPFHVFLRITLPLSLPGLVNGFLLGFARSLGEFGATITFAGNIAGKTRTVPLAVYSLLQVPGREGDVALLVAFSVGISFLAMLGGGAFSRREKEGRL